MMSSMTVLSFGPSCLPFLALVAALFGCGPNPSGPADAVDAADPQAPQRLTTAAAWRATDPADDPFADHAPADAPCPPDATRVTADGLLDVDTGSCTYLAIEQPARRPVAANGRVRLLLWHLDLYAVEPAQAHAALELDGVILWERTIDIPAAPAVYDEVLPVAGPVQAGATVRFHLHNHGTNEWLLAPLEILDAVR